MENPQRELTALEVNLMNEIRAKGQELQGLIDRVNAANTELLNLDAPARALVVDTEAMRWSDIARTDFQTGCMALKRAVAKANFF